MYFFLVKYVLGNQKTHQIIKYKNVFKKTTEIKITVGHVPMELSRFIWFFVDLGGTVTGRVMDNKPRRSPIPSAGLEIKLLLTFKWD